MTGPGNNGYPASALASVMGTSPRTPSVARARARGLGAVPLRDQPPESVAERLAGLPQWQARYVLALMELGGVIGLAATRCKVSRQSVEKAMHASPDFAGACAEAVAHSTELVEAAAFRGATVGDLTPIYQGGLLVGYKRVRNVKDAELMLKIRGRLREETEVRHTGKVEMVQPADMPAVLADTMKRLFAARGKPLIDAASGKPVSV